MSDESIEVVRRAIWAFENDADAFKTMQSPDSVWFPFEDNHSPSYGIEGAIRVRSQWHDAWAEYRLEIEDVVAEGENVVASLHVTGTGRASGVPVDVRMHVHFKVRDGKIVYTYEHLDKAAALEAAGLRHTAKR
jgi:ketosteroid isomerase-like protein